VQRSCEMAGIVVDIVAEFVEWLVGIEVVAGEFVVVKDAAGTDIETQIEVDEQNTAEVVFVFVFVFGWVDKEVVEMGFLVLIPRVAWFQSRCSLSKEL